MPPESGPSGPDPVVPPTPATGPGRTRRSSTPAATPTTRRTKAPTALQRFNESKEPALAESDHQLELAERGLTRAHTKYDRAKAVNDEVRASLGLELQSAVECPWSVMSVSSQPAVPSTPTDDAVQPTASAREETAVPSPEPSTATPERRTPESPSRPTRPTAWERIYLWWQEVKDHRRY